MRPSILPAKTESWSRALYIKNMALTDGAVSTEFSAQKIPEGVLDMTTTAPLALEGQKVFVYYNGPTDQLSGVSAGACILDPGASPHPPHQHPEEEFLIIGEGTGEIECDGKVTNVGPGAMMYCAGNTMHGIINTGKTPMTFYWSKWLAKGFST
jgi:mannose-6-phosphate isomerase-like protein (cupin superfamily)